MYLQRSEPTESSLNLFETYLTVATLTATPINPHTHNRLFSSSTEFYEQTMSSLPDSLTPLDLPDVSEALLATTMPAQSPPVITPLKPSTFRPGRLFGRSPVPNHKFSPPRSTPVSSSPEPKAGKVDGDTMKTLKQLHEKLAQHRALVFTGRFSSLAPDDRRWRVDDALAFARESLTATENLRSKAK
ncbi:hypothetical protein L218DRAFT_158699 [Marasmius fiardii PR-910]|nr:hypothetical protein L218DRAFT_158699 [Marasmius fiardii PR-910]